MPKSEGEVEGRLTAEILRQNAIPFLLYLSRHAGWHAPTLVAKKIAGIPRHARGTAERLRAAGLVEMQPAGLRAGKQTWHVRITPAGRELVTLLRPVVAKVEKRPGGIQSRPRR